jgi:hypothetical protein
MVFINQPVQEPEKSLRDYASLRCEDIRVQESVSKLEATKYEIKSKIFEMVAANPFASCCGPRWRMWPVAAAELAAASRRGEGSASSPFLLLVTSPAASPPPPSPATGGADPGRWSLLRLPPRARGSQPLPPLFSGHWRAVMCDRNQDLSHRGRRTRKKGKMKGWNFFSPCRLTRCWIASRYDMSSRPLVSTSAAYLFDRKLTQIRRGLSIS